MEQTAPLGLEEQEVSKAYLDDPVKKEHKVEMVHLEKLVLEEVLDHLALEVTQEILVH